MKKRLSIIIPIIALNISCNQSVSTNPEKQQNKSKVEIQKESESLNKIKNEQFIQNDSLAYAFEAELEVLATTSPKFSLKVRPYQNHHDENVIDTIKTYKFDKTELEFYKASNWEHIIGGVIKNSEIYLGDSIKVGITKATLGKKLNISINSDIVQLGNLEQTSLFIFEFNNDVLNTIKFEGYFD
ncbi:hypothetical protein [Flagellimonas zhangzhouensis]|uniref:Uncharacterized protein n=1 Tax=Flagellimonas zhangzhouensis TaxID=1073328 RepID=A0A1H2Q9U9_9FLAO|nr:hypothetical protein [Allomuricauda zhangzhouensis]SDQ50609.1 hypothetical protein SAMN05216294_1490 [Allomuricauda zhangzhouensis]SDW04027.1 hypothetical protein SAMN04487892_0141 [Allomuricauda zhangzhouensis]